MLAEVSIPILVLATVALVLSTLGLLDVLDDPYTESVLPWVGMCSPALTTLWMSLELVWTRSVHDFLQRFMTRALVLNGVFVLVNLAVHAVVAWGPAGRSAAEHPDSRTPSQVGVYLEAVFTFALLGYGAAMLTGLVALVLVVIPVKAIREPRELGRANARTPGADDSRFARLAGIGLSITLILCFAVPTLIVVGAETANAETVSGAFGNVRLFFGDIRSYAGDLAWATGVVLVPVSLGVMVLTRLATRKAEDAVALRGRRQPRR